MNLALREIRRAKLRFGLLSTAVGLLIFLILFQQTLLGTLLGFFTGALENQSGQVVVYNEESRRNLAGSIISDEQFDAIAQVDGIATIGPLGEGTFTAFVDGGETDASIWGYDLDGPGEPTTLVDGRLPETDFEAVASSTDAAAGFGIGAEIGVANGELSITIVGLASDIRFSVQPVMFVSYATWEAVTRAVNPDAPFVLPSVAMVQPVAGLAPDTLAERITSMVDGVEALDRATAVDSLPGVSEVRQSFNLILLLSFVVVTLVVGFFFLIITVQKLASLGLLKALGYSTGRLVWSLALQVLAVTVTGILIGATLLVVASLTSGDAFPIEADPALIATTSAIVLVFAGLASVGSLRRVARVEATDVLGRQNTGGIG